MRLGLGLGRDPACSQVDEPRGASNPILTLTLARSLALALALALTLTLSNLQSG